MEVSKDIKEMKFEHACSSINMFDKKRIKKFDDKHFCKYKHNLYHYKIRNNLDIVVNELLGEIISEYFKLDTVKSKFFKERCFNKYILLTKVFDIKGYEVIKLNFDNFFEFGYNDEIGLDNLRRLDTIRYKGEKKQYNVELLKLNIKKMIIRDFITNQTDRHEKNFLFKINNNDIKMLPLFDYEFSFLYNHYFEFNNWFNFDLKLDSVLETVRNDLEFQELLYKAMDLDVYKMFYQLQDEYPIILMRNEMDKYNDIIKEKKEIIKEYKLIK